MKSFILTALAATTALAQSSLPPVNSEDLQALISLEELVSGSQTLQNQAYNYPQRNRVFGGQAHNDTVNFLADTLNALDYYNVTVQPFVELFSGGNATLSVNGAAQNVSLFTYAPRGSANGSVVVVNNLGCNATDYPPQVQGAIALIPRGVCTFGIKATQAQAAGAIGALVYNNVPGSLAGTLGGAGNFPPVAGISQELGQNISQQLGNGTAVTANLVVNSILENRTTYNVIAETLGGDHDNVIALGAHTDSVEAGPGINDDGSGTIGILNVAIALSNFSTTNAVRFCFWSAEEYGLLGSRYYVRQLNQSATELAKVRAYLNFDMIASPNYAYLIYDGDGSTFNLTGPPGSAEIETMFQEYYDSRGKPYNATAFDGRSDYGPFLDVGIAAGGIFTGAEQVKTAEEQFLFGGIRDIAYDYYYHQAGDNIFNLALDAFLLNTQLIAHSIATYATSFDSLPPKNATTLTKRHTDAHRQKVSRSLSKQAGHGHAHHCLKDVVAK